MGQPVVHFEIGTKALNSCSEFYASLFGWDITKDQRGYGLVNTRADSGIGGGLLQTPEQVPPYVTLYVQVDDLDKYLLKVEELGGRRIMGPMPVPGVGSFAMFSDLDGNPIGLFQELPSSKG